MMLGAVAAICLLGVSSVAFIDPEVVKRELRVKGDVLPLELTTSLPDEAELLQSGAPHYDTKFEGFGKVTSFDGTVLRFNGYRPVSSDPNQRFPVVILPNSWIAPELEYLLRCKWLARRGFITVEYETRGWWFSGGMIDMAGPKDRADAKVIVDFVLRQADGWKVDKENIAFAGISYGAGIALLAAGNDPRVKTAVSMSGWGSIYDFVLGNNSPNIAWMNYLKSHTKIIGRPPKILFDMFDDVVKHQNLSFVREYAGMRSPGSLYSAEFNRRQVPLFFSSNYIDRIFRVQFVSEFYNNLTTKKFMMLNQGDHATPEAFGLFVFPNKVWDNALEWLQFHLQGMAPKTGGVITGPPVRMEYGGTMLSLDYLGFDNIPGSGAGITPSVRLALGPRGAAKFGSLSAADGAARGAAPFGSKLRLPIDAPRDTIAFSKDPGLSSQADKDMDRCFGKEVLTNLTAANRAASIVYTTAPLARDMLFCGQASITMNFTLTGADAAMGWQFYGFLYSITPANAAGGVVHGEYLTETFQGFYGAAPGGMAAVRDLMFHSLCRTVKAGSRVALGLTAYNSQYVPVSQKIELAPVYGSALITIPTPTPLN